MAPLLLRPREVSFHLIDCRARLPFRFGVHTLTAAPLCVARVLAETTDGRIVEGLSSDLLVPRWFEKTPGQSVIEDWNRLIRSARAAGAALLDAPTADSVFELWLALYRRRVPPAPESERLMLGEGVSLIERALIDAACRAAGVTFFTALTSNLLGFRSERLDPTIAAFDLSAALPTRPLNKVHVRHTVGLADALRREDAPAASRTNDGLPESLEEDIEQDGVAHFKLKLSGALDADVDRLLRIVEVVTARVSAPRFTLDGNEQFSSMRDLVRILEQLRRHDPGRALLSNLLVIEQPLSRARTFDPAANAGIEAVTTFAPCIIDEADAELNSFPRAADLGYRGVSVKNCKGVFRALFNFARCSLSHGRFLQTAEDLTNLPVIALQQDLATISAIGITHAERNGHHYFHGLRHLSAPTRAAALGGHPDLYVDSAAGPRLRIINGMIATSTLHDAIGYAFNVPHDLRGWTRAEDWTPNHMLPHPPTPSSSSPA